MTLAREPIRHIPGVLPLSDEVIDACAAEAVERISRALAPKPLAFYSPLVLRMMRDNAIAHANRQLDWARNTSHPAIRRTFQERARTSLTEAGKIAVELARREGPPA